MFGKIVDFGFQAFAHFRRGQTERIDFAALQEQTLLRLVRHAANTRFGRQHGFAAIHSLPAYQNQVPLRTYEDFWEEFWQPAFPRHYNTTWPGSPPYLALSSGTTCGTTKYIPVTREMLRSNRRAALTALAWLRDCKPQFPLFSGKLFFLGGSSALQRLAAAGPLAGDLSGIVAKEVFSLLRPYTYPPLDVALLSDWDRKLEVFADQSAALPISLLSGVPSWMLVLFDQLRRVTGKQTIAEIWPTLRVVVHGGTNFEPYRTLFREVIGSEEVQYLETYPASEGFVAAEDPRHSLLRLIPDHNVFYEFVPVGELNSPDPTRHTAATIVPGVQYAVVLTTCAGLWSYVLGDTVCFESVSPPLLRFTGRTKQFLSAFGEHLIGEEVEQAVACAAESCGAAVSDFHVGPQFPDLAAEPGRHQFLVEFVTPPWNLQRFAETLDAELSRLNEDYRAHRAGDLTLAIPEVLPVPRGGFADWMRSRGKLGGQHKVPRLDNSGELTAELARWIAEHARRNDRTLAFSHQPGVLACPQQ